MASSSRRRRRGLVATGAVLGVAVACSFALVALRSQPATAPPAAPVAEAPTPGEATSPELPALTARQDALLQVDQTRVGHAAHVALGRTTPFVSVVDARHTAASVALVVPARARPWSLAELMSAAPTAFRRLGDGSVLVLRPVVVGAGATLVVDSAVTSRLLLTSGASGYVSLTASQRSTLVLRGHADRPLRVTSWDMSTGTEDDDLADGRAYVVDLGGRLDLQDAWLGHLGYGIGWSSGVAWMGSKGILATGSASRTTFHHNYFGAYAADASALQITESTFTRNIGYGFDPHTRTAGLLVAGSVASDNGKHGFIVSRGCSNNTFVDDLSTRNAGSGFVVDDGAASEGRQLGSDLNLLQRVVATDNTVAGIAIEGGAGNQVVDATVGGNSYGVWVRHGALDTEVLGTHVTSATRSGILIGSGAVGTTVSGSDVRGAPLGLQTRGATRTTLAHDDITVDSGHALDLGRRSESTRTDDVALHGSGKDAVVVAGQPAEAPSGTDVSDWVVTGRAADTAPVSGAQVAHLAVVAVPLLVAIPMVLHRRRSPSFVHHRAVGLRP